MTQLFADFSDSLIPKTKLKTRFARTISEVVREYEHMNNIDISEFFDEYEDGDDCYAGPIEASKFFQTLPNEFIVTNNMNGIKESFKITKTGLNIFTAKEAK
jgi:hypothetical protein